ncbi:MAG: nitroreductase family protein [Planctomycetota bacterium JB042]
MDVGEAIARRRSVRRFDRERPVPRELLLEVLDAGRWAPSSCNLQTWDFVVVEDDATRRALAEEVKSVLIAPVAVFVVYDRELAKEGLANVQSASASIQTMLLKATSVGLASLWVNALGDRDRVRERLGVPDDFEVLALVCLGYPRDDAPPPAPQRRPLDDVVHFDRYRGRGGLPKSPDPNDWSLEELALYFKRKLQSGTRYNKPRASFHDPVERAVERALAPALGADGEGKRLLDVLSGTGLLTERLHRRWPKAALAVAEVGVDAWFFANRRAGGRVSFVPFPADRAEAILEECAAVDEEVAVARESGGLPVMPRVLPRPPLAEGAFDAATILFRLEGIPRAVRGPLLAAVRERLVPGGVLAVAYTSRRSWHRPAYALRRRLGRDSVETSPVPEPNLIGPFEPLAPAEVRELLRGAGFVPVGEERLEPLPDLDVILPRLERSGGLLRLMGKGLRLSNAVLKPFSSLLKPFARTRVVWLKRS